MTKEDIITWAREAGISIRGHYDETGPTPQELLRFAASVIKSLKPSLQTEFEKMFMEGAAAEREAFPDLTAVINWLENGCDPKEAAKELRLYAAAIRARRKT